MTEEEARKMDEDATTGFVAIDLDVNTYKD